MVQRINAFIKEETVLAIAFALAVLSCFLVKPDAAYIRYIDFHTLALLFCLMAVMSGLQEVGLLRRRGGAFGVLDHPGHILLSLIHIIS